MKTRYLVVFACLLMVACDKPVAKKSEAPPAESSVVEKADPPAKAAALENAGEVEAEVPTTPTGKLGALKKKYNSAMNDFRRSYVKAKSAEEKQALFEEKYPKAEDFAAGFMKLAEDHPEDEVATDALLWVVQQSRGGDVAATATDRLLSNYVDSEKLTGLCSSLQRGEMSEKTIKSLELLREKSPHEKVKAAATFGLASFYSNVQSSQKAVLGNDAYEKQMGEESVAFLKEFEFDKEKVEGLFQTLVDDYADLKPSERSKRTYEEMANAALFELNNLQIGNVAPDIEGEDLDGTEFKLSDYRGKVVVIDFWGDW